MKKNYSGVSNPDDLNNHLQYTSPFTWISLGAVVAILIAFFAWSFLYRIKEKLTGEATILSGQVTLEIKDGDLTKLKVGQKVYISSLEGEILSFEDSQPVVSTFDLKDGEYTYTIVLREIRPIDYLIK